MSPPPLSLSSRTRAIFARLCCFVILGVGGCDAPTDGPVLGSPSTSDLTLGEGSELVRSLLDVGEEYLNYELTLPAVQFERTASGDYILRSSALGRCGGLGLAPLLPCLIQVLPGVGQ